MAFEAYSRFYVAGSTTLDYYRLAEIRDYLESRRIEEIDSVEAARSYIRIVAEFRKLIEFGTAQNGKNFLRTIQDLLSVGENGLYDNKLRFLFELIQNVDDCEFESGKIPSLVIDFDDTSHTLTLKYNEDGFMPANVFAITGIAEGLKNNTQGRLEIGEKGIGFKSVFGVAKSVLIRSGRFSFRLAREHFTIPVPEYSDGFEGVAGTELSLEFDSTAAFEEVRKAIEKRYADVNALFIQNPIVFLNKIRSIEFRSAGDLILGFSVKRPSAEKCEWGRVSPETVLEVYDNASAKRISGTMYSAPITFGRGECVSRYGEETALKSRSLELQAFFPDPEWVFKGKNGIRLTKGVLYSFLPTQVETSVPVICHAPFKLDASRENVDSQKENAWFTRTIGCLGTFVRFCYRVHAQRIRESIVPFLPKFTGHFFERKYNDKLEPLLVRPLEGSEIVTEKVFFCNDGRLHSISDVVALDGYERLHRPEDVVRLCQIGKPLFVFPEGYYPQRFNMNIVERPLERMLSKVFTSLFDVLDDIRIAIDVACKCGGPTFQLDEFLLKDRHAEWNVNHIIALAETGKLKSLLGALVREIQRRVEFGPYVSHGRFQDGSVLDLIDPSVRVRYEDMGANAENYFRRIAGACVCVQSANGVNGVFPARNVCVVLGDDPSGQLVELCRRLDPQSLFSVRLKLQSASRRLDAVMSVDDPREFLKFLRDIRSTSKQAMGASAYKNYLDLIQKSGSDSARFVKELIQNADDCEYPAGAIPSCRIEWSENEISFATNEVGFNTQNVRAITAIGESTKRRILGEDGAGLRQTIGEKGIGFKSVFAIADEVDVHSGRFHFKLASESPTVPELIEGCEDRQGTFMRMMLKSSVALPSYSDVEILELCLCLRRLKEMRLCGHTVTIEDGDCTRRISVDGQSHEFILIRIPFQVSDMSAIRERSGNGRIFDSAQEVRCYVPMRIKNVMSYPLYCGLPTCIKTRAPLVIDAPFELTTSRDDILKDSRWNDVVRRTLREVILKVALLARSKIRINVLYFFGIEEGRRHSETRIDYRVKMFEGGLGGEYLNADADLIDRIREAEIIPIVGDHENFYRPNSGDVRVFPAFLSKALAAADVSETPCKQVDFEGVAAKETALKVLSALGVDEIHEDEFWDVVESIGRLETLMEEKTFREGVYAYLRRLDGASNIFWSKPIVPVITPEGVRYVTYDEGEFYFSEERRTSTKSYYIIDTECMDRHAYEALFGVDLKEMNAAQERDIYANSLISALQNGSLSKNYECLLAELEGPNSETLQMCWPNVYHACKGMIALKGLDGSIGREKRFVCSQSMIDELGPVAKVVVVAPKCRKLAQLMECEHITQVTYNRLGDAPWEFEERDIQLFKRADFAHGDDILILAARNGRISEELALQYGLSQGLAATRVDRSCTFPTEPVPDILRLKAHIREQLDNPIAIIGKTVQRIVPFGRTADGAEFDLSSAKCRGEMLARYSAVEDRGVAFCQMCGKPRRHAFMEVNAIELKPEYYWSQMRLCLCLECSKRFELLRNDEMFRADFFRKLRSVDLGNLRDNVRVRMPLRGGEAFEVVFTRAHISEIREILGGTNVDCVDCVGVQFGAP